MVKRPPPEKSDLATALAVKRQMEREVMADIAQGWRAFAEKWGQWDKNGEFHYTDRLRKQLGEVGLATTVYHAMRGDLKAAELLLKYGLPEPEQSFTVKVQQFSLEQAEAAKAELLKEMVERGYTPATAKALVASLETGE